MEKVRDLQHHSIDQENKAVEQSHHRHVAVSGGGPYLLQCPFAINHSIAQLMLVLFHRRRRHQRHTRNDGMGKHVKALLKERDSGVLVSITVTHRWMMDGTM